MTGPRASSEFNPDRDLIFQFSDTKNFRKKTHGFKFGALVNLQALTATFAAPYSNEAAYQAYVK